MSDFDPKNFIDRDQELNLVLGRVSDLAQGKPFAPRERVFHFTGPSGIGKSFLLRKIYALLAEQPDVVPILISLEELKGNEHGILDELLKMIYLQFCEYRKINTNPVLKEPLKPRHEYASMVVRAISLRKEILPILLLDEIDVLSQKDMQETEEYLLVRIIHGNDHAVLVTASRSQSGFFNDIALRPNPVNTFLLPVFDEKKTGKQMESLKPGSGILAGKIQVLGSGVPGNTVELVGHISGKPPDIPNEIQAVQSLLDSIKKDNKIDPRYSPMLEALSILQGFFPEDAAPLFQNHPQLGPEWDEGRVKGIVMELSKIQIGPGGLVDWDREKKHWAMDESTRDLFERELQMRTPELWRKLHCTALRMYQEWGQMYDSSMFRNKATYHQDRLQSAGMTCA